jgi:LPXTG-motif cell wall-anchored protein
MAADPSSAASNGLADTGSNLGSIWGITGLLLAAGLGLFAAGRRRMQQS